MSGTVCEYRRQSLNRSGRLPSNPVRIVLASRSLLAFTPTWRAAALALAELGAAAFFAAGIAEAAVGPSAAWWVLAAVWLGVVVRAVDVEARGLFVRGGLFGLVREALGESASRVAASAHFVERVLLGPLAAAVAGRYVVAMLLTVFRPQISSAAAENAAVAAAFIVLAGCGWDSVVVKCSRASASRGP